MPNAKESTATVVTNGVARSERRASRRSVSTLNVIGDPFDGRTAPDGVRRAASPYASVSTAVRVQNATTAAGPVARARAQSRANTSHMPAPKRCRNAGGYSRSSAP